MEVLLAKVKMRNTDVEDNNKYRRQGPDLQEKLYK